MSGFSTMLAFLEELRDNNNRQWFAEQKGRYQAIRAACFGEIERLVGAVSGFDSHIAGLAPKNATYRIYRDIRFAADKSPFKTHFGIVLAKDGKKAKEGGYYLHLEPGNCALYGGVWFPEPPVLRFLRRNIYDNIDEFLEIVNNPVFRQVFPKMVGDSLKKMPAGYPKDYPFGEIIKKKEFLVCRTYDDVFFENTDWMESAVADIRLLYPFVRYFNCAFEERREMEDGGSW